MAKRRSARRAARASGAVNLSMSQKIDMVVKNLIAFFILFAVSFILYKVTSAVFWNDLFFLLMLVFGFVGLAFLIVWLILMFLKASRR